MTWKLGLRRDYEERPWNAGAETLASKYIHNILEWLLNPPTAWLLGFSAWRRVSLSLAYKVHANISYSGQEFCA